MASATLSMLAMTALRRVCGSPLTHSTLDRLCYPTAERQARGQASSRRTQAHHSAAAVCALREPLQNLVWPVQDSEAAPELGSTPLLPAAAPAAAGAASRQRLTAARSCHGLLRRHADIPWQQNQQQHER